MKYVKSQLLNIQFLAAENNLKF